MKSTTRMERSDYRGLVVHCGSISGIGWSVGTTGKTSLVMMKVTPPRCWSTSADTIFKQSEGRAPGLRYCCDSPSRQATSRPAGLHLSSPLRRHYWFGAVAGGYGSHWERPDGLGGGDVPHCLDFLPHVNLNLISGEYRNGLGVGVCSPATGLRQRSRAGKHPRCLFAANNALISCFGQPNAAFAAAATSQAVWGRAFESSIMQ